MGHFLDGGGVLRGQTQTRQCDADGDARDGSAQRRGQRKEEPVAGLTVRIPNICV